MLSVLVADDHEVTRRGLRDVLREAFGDVEVVETCDGDEVVAVFSRQRWDLVLLDIRMPGPNIIDLLEHIRAADSEVPVLVLTAATELEYVPQTMRAGASGLVYKHHAADDLLEAVRKVLSGSTYLHSETAAAIASGLQESSGALAHDKLSQRERQIFVLIARGRTIKEIAGDLGLSDKTVATYLARIREKTGLISLVDIARYALQHGLVQ